MNYIAFTDFEGFEIGGNNMQFRVQVLHLAVMGVEKVC